MDKKAQRVLNVLAKARFEDPESDGWIYSTDVWRRIERNRLGWRTMGPASVLMTLWRLEDDGLVEATWRAQPPEFPYQRRRAYRITEHGHRERARNPVRVRGHLIGKSRLAPNGR